LSPCCFSLDPSLDFFVAHCDDFCCLRGLLGILSFPPSVARLFGRKFFGRFYCSLGKPHSHPVTTPLFPRCFLFRSAITFAVFLLDFWDLFTYTCRLVPTISSFSHTVTSSRVSTSRSRRTLFLFRSSRHARLSYSGGLVISLAPLDSPAPDMVPEVPFRCLRPGIVPFLFGGSVVAFTFYPALKRRTDRHLFLQASF